MHFGISIPGVDAMVRITEMLAGWYLLRKARWREVSEASRAQDQREAPLMVVERLLRVSENDRRGVISRIELAERFEQVKKQALEFTGGDQVSVILSDSWTEDIMSLEPRERAG